MKQNDNLNIPTLYKEVIGTLCFFSLFETAVSKNVLRDYLLKQDESMLHTEAEFNDCIETLQTVGIVKMIEDDNEQLFTLAEKPGVKNESASKLMRKVLDYRWVFNSTPFVEMVGVCNTVALGTSKETSDIDLFIVTKDERLFTARLLVTLLTQVLGIRRHGSKTAGRFCLSFFVEESAMNIEAFTLSNDIYMAFWLKSMSIVYARNIDTINQFEGKNSEWIKRRFHHGRKIPATIMKQSHTLKKIGEWILGGYIGEHIESILRTLQLTRARKKASHLTDTTGTIVSKTVLKFHDNDRRKEFFTGWQELFERTISRTLDHGNP